MFASFAAMGVVSVITTTVVQKRAVRGGAAALVVYPRRLLCTGFAVLFCAHAFAVAFLTPAHFPVWALLCDGLLIMFALPIVGAPHPIPGPSNPLPLPPCPDLPRPAPLLAGAPNSAIFASKIVEGRKGEFMSLNQLVGGVARILGPTAGTSALHVAGHIGVFGVLAGAYTIVLLCLCCMFTRLRLPAPPGAPAQSSRAVPPPSEGGAAAGGETYRVEPGGTARLDDSTRGEPGGEPGLAPLRAQPPGDRGRSTSGF